MPESNNDQNQRRPLRYTIKTFGCQMNFADSDEMVGHLTRHGFLLATSIHEADVVLVNTCTVRDLAEHKAESFIGRLRQWRELNPGRLLIVTGCAAERAKKQFKQKFPFIDLIVGAKDIEEFPKLLNEAIHQQALDEEMLIPSIPIEAPRDYPRPSSVVQYVTIMRGCNYNCTYCIVPSVRGRERYRPISDIISDINQKIENGAKEIWLLGQTVNSYKPPQSPFPDYDFSDLLNDVALQTSISRIRYISPHPHYLTRKMIQTIAQNRKVCPQIHLPVQSGSTDILRRMKRNYTRESYLTSIKELRRHVPSISITTDIIVGFPGESDKDFEQTLSLIDEAGFDSAYCFKYSPRPGTEAFELGDDIDDEIKEKRVNFVLQKMEKQAILSLRPLMGSTQEVLVESQKDNNIFRGKTPHGWQVRFSAQDINLGELAMVTITGHHSTELQGEVAFSKLHS